MQRDNKVPENMRRRFIIITAILAVLSLALSIYAWRNTRFPGDLYLTLQLQSFHNETFRSVMEWLSYSFANWRAALIVIAAGLLFWWQIGRLEGILFPVAGILSFIADALKLAINQPRPSVDLVKVLTIETSRGFPSSHAFFSVLVLGLTAYLLFIHLRAKRLKVFSLAALILLGLLVGTSRIYLGVHWTSEVIGGYVIGGVFLMILLWFYQNRRSSKTDP
jgi:membrane-associated phospholipid phosphatase